MGMQGGDPQDTGASVRTVDRRFFFVVLALLSVALVAVSAALWGALLWALALAIVFHPADRWMQRRWGLGPRMAAALTTLAVVLGVMLPAMLVVGFVGQEVADFLARVRAGEIDLAARYRSVLQNLPGWLAQLLERAGLGDLPAALRKARDGAGEGAQPLATQAWTLGQRAMDVVLGVFVMAYVLYHLLADADGLRQRLARVVPLRPAMRHRLGEAFVGAVRATVKGGLVVAAVQGALGVAAFLWLDVPGAVLWGVLMGMASLVPPLGSSLVWGPVALMLLLRGDVAQAAGLAAFGAVVIAMVDNLLAPVLVGKGTRLPDWVVLVTTIGAIALVGINGFVVGPVVAAVTFAAWQALADAREAAWGGPLEASGVPPAPPGPDGGRRGRG